MSGLAHHSPDYQTLSIDTPGTYISQQVSGFDVTISRDASNGRHNRLDVPVTVNFSASIGSTTPGGDPVSLPASASNTFTPVNESVTFPAGVATQTVRIPVRSGAANPGSVPIELAVSSSTPGVAISSHGGGPPSAVVYLVDGTAALPPTAAGITSAHLIMQGESASGIAITFSKPMAPASVENIRNYKLVKAGPIVTGWDYLFLEKIKVPTHLPVPLKAALYDPMTNTVTLIPKKPLRSSARYTLLSPVPLLKQNTLMDLQGTALEGNVHYGAAFVLELRGDRALNWAAPAPATIFGGN